MDRSIGYLFFRRTTILGYGAATFRSRAVYASMAGHTASTRATPCRMTWSSSFVRISGGTFTFRLTNGTASGGRPMRGVCAGTTDPVTTKPADQSAASAHRFLSPDGPVSTRASPSDGRRRPTVSGRSGTTSPFPFPTRQTPARRFARVAGILPESVPFGPAPFRRFAA